jgi:predicted acyltransferase
MQNRFLSLDIFRGLTIALMIIVNTPGSWDYVFPPLDHAKWHGCTPTDWVFPSFVFAMGISMRFSFQPYHYQLDFSLLKKIFKRAAIIYLLYLVFMQFFPFFFYDKNGVAKIFMQDENGWHLFRKNPLRPLGVLPRLALCYAFGAVICLLTPLKKLPYLAAGLLLLYWGILYFFGEAGNPYGVSPSLNEWVGMTEAEITNWWKSQMTTNAAHRLDFAILGEKYMYKGEGYAFEPEGILSTLPAIVTAMLGYLIGAKMQTTTDKMLLIKWLIGLGAVAVGGSLVWDLVLPINKKIWTSSYVLHMAGVDMLILGVLTFVLDYKKITDWSFFFKVFGANAITAFLVSEVPIIASSRFRLTEPDGTVIGLLPWIYRHGFASWAGNMNGSFFFAVWFMLMCWLVLYVMYRKKIFLKV